MQSRRDETKSYNKDSQLRNFDRKLPSREGSSKNEGFGSKLGYQRQE